MTKTKKKAPKTQASLKPAPKAVKAPAAKPAPKKAAQKGGSIKQQAKGLVAGIAKKAQKLLTPTKEKKVEVKVEAKKDTKKAAAPVVVQAVVTQPKQKGKGKHALPITQLSNIGRGGKGPDAMMSKKALNDAVCREVACEGLATTSGYCRLHYIKNWKKIKRKELILKEKKLNVYIEELVSKYPDKYIEAIRQDLASDKDFAKVIYDLELDESIDDFDGEGGDSDEAIIDSIKRDFDGDDDAF